MPLKLIVNLLKKDYPLHIAYSVINEMGWVRDELVEKFGLVCHDRHTKSGEVIQIIQNYLKRTWTREQFSNTILKGLISFKTIYRWIYYGNILLGDLSYLRQKGKRRKPRETRGRFNTETSIYQRPLLNVKHVFTWLLN